MQVQKRNGETLEGIHVVKKTPEESYISDAARGKITENADGQGVQVILYDAKVILPSKQQSRVQELHLNLIKEISK